MPNRKEMASKLAKNVSLGVVVIVLVVGWGMYQLNQYQAEIVGSFGDSASFEKNVTVSTFDFGGQYPLGTSVDLNVVATAPSPILSLELWIDGELRGVQAGVQGSAKFVGPFSWTAGEAGVYSLVVRVILEGDSFYSNGLQIQIMPGPEDNDVKVDYAALGGVFPGVEDGHEVGDGSSGGPGYPPDPIQPGEMVAEGKEWEGTLGDMMTSRSADMAPDVPGLLIDINNCSIDLFIKDNSSNEEGFRLYRDDFDGVGWVQVAMLASQNEADWISVYTDYDIFGSVSYYVSAFNGGGETKSAPAMVTTLNECPKRAEGTGQPVLKVNLAGVFNSPGVQNAYCYKSIGDGPWTRWPEDGFLTQTEGEWIAPGTAEALLLTGVGGETVMTPKSLDMECWGWAGGTGGSLVYLGDFHAPIDTSSLKSPEFTGDLFNPKVTFALGTTGDGGYLGDPPKPPGFDLYTQQGLPEINPLHPQMPDIVARVTNDVEDCEDHYVPYENYPYLNTPNCEVEGHSNFALWNLLDTCGAGEGGACMSYFDWIDKVNASENEGDELGFYVHVVNEDGYNRYGTKAQGWWLDVLPDELCDKNTQFRVQMYYWDLSGDGLSEDVLYVGPYSNVVEMPPGCDYVEVGFGVVSVDTGYEIIPIHPQIPQVFATITKDPQECREHYAYWQTYDFGNNYSECEPEQYFNEVDYLVWNFGQGCNAGYGTPPCKTYLEWLELTQNPDNNDDIGFEVYILNSDGYSIESVKHEGWMAMAFPKDYCYKQTTFRVRMYYYNESEDHLYHGPLSNEVKVPLCELDDVGVEDVEIEAEMPPEVGLVEISFDTFTLSNADDGSDSSLELYGYLSAWSTVIDINPHDLPSWPRKYLMTDKSFPFTLGDHSILQIARWDYQVSDCADDISGFDSDSNYTPEGLGCTQQVGDGTYSLAEDFYMCLSSKIDLGHDCIVPAWGYTTVNLSEGFHVFGYYKTDYLYNNNKAYVFVTDNSKIVLRVLFVDWDDSFGNDIVCEAFIQLPARSLTDWENINEGFVFNTPDFGSGKCKINGTIRGVASP